ncbi:MAG: Omp28-related outer membrane protein [Flavobacteriales bacterium]
MKKSLLILFAAALTITSCSDKEDPIIKLNNQYLENVYGSPPQFELLDNPTKNVLVEEFTGHKCGFCPPATALLKQWAEELGPRLVPIAIHAGTLASVGAEPFETDYNTDEGNFFWAQVEGGFNPSARVDRITGAQNAYPYNDWMEMINAQMDESPKVALQGVAGFVSEDGIVNVHIHGQFLENLSDSYNLVVLLSESHIISAQEDYDQTPSEILDYEHNHVLRDGITIPEGLPVATAPSANDVFVKSFSYEINPNWVWSNSHIVAYLIDVTTGDIVNALELEIVE